MARNHVWRYTLRLFHILAIFEKRRKIDAKREPKTCVFSFKNVPRTPQGRLILPFGPFLADSKNHCFFVVVQSVQKSRKISLLVGLRANRQMRR